jgi:hypothetical protein
MFHNFILHAVSTPSQRIVQRPIANLFVGMQLDLTCIINFPNIFGVDPIISVTWRKDGLDLVNNDLTSVDRAAMQVAPNVYEQNLVFHALQDGAHGTYSCNTTVRVRAGNFNSEVSGSPASYQINIESEFVSIHCFQLGGVE